MQTEVVFRCEFCGKIDPRPSRIRECEASHYGITRSDYLAWKKLNANASDAGAYASLRKDRPTEEAFDLACRELADFEAAHGLTGRKRPSDFF